jgi:hypothetical protein
VTECRLFASESAAYSATREGNDTLLILNDMFRREAPEQIAKSKWIPACTEMTS